MGAALGMLRRLAQEILAAGKLTVKLIVQVIPVCNYNNSRALQRFLQIMGIEHHRQRFPAALCMPEHAAFSICDGGMLGGFDCFLYSEILMISGKHFECLLAVHVEADKVFQDVEKTILLKYTFKESVKLSVLGVLIASVRRFPLHVAIFAGGKRSSFRSAHVAHDADCIINEHGRNLIHIVAKLAVCVGSVRLFTGRGFQLHHNKRQTINKKNDVRAFL